MAREGTYQGNEVSQVIDADDRRQQQQHQVSPGKISKTTTTTTTISTKTTKSSILDDVNINNNNTVKLNSSNDETLNVAAIEDLGRQASMNSPTSIRRNLSSLSNYNTSKSKNKQFSDTDYSSKKFSDSTNLIEHAPAKLRDDNVEGNKRVTTIATVAAQSGQSRIVLALLKDANSLQLKIQEMRPGIFEVGANFQECLKYFEEHEKLMKNLRKQKQTPIECWMKKYEDICKYKEPNMSTERKLVYMCMAENLQGCWKALLNQLDQRTRLLETACRFYESCERLIEALDQSDNHVQVFRQEFLNGPNSSKFDQACNELKRLNEQVLNRYNLARINQQKLIDLVSVIGTGNLGDARVNYLISDAKALITYINTYLDPLERRKLQLESVITTSKSTTTNILNNQNNTNGKSKQYKNRFQQKDQSSIYTDQTSANLNGNGKYPLKSNIVREISNFNDLVLIENWLNVKIEQLNSSLLSSLGVGVPDSRSILSKHEQIALECRTIEEATLTFNGRNIHAIKSLEPKDDKVYADKSLFEQQKLLAIKVRDVITILDVRIVLLRRTIDFYNRSKEATSDISKMMRRLQIDNSLQSVQFVANELEFKDVSSVVASGATIISELQQLQLAQQHGQRSRIVNLNLVTNGIRSIIDQLNQELAHLKTVLNQRKLILLNEDANKMANNFSNKCHQLHFWLNNHVKSYLLNNNLLQVLDDIKMRQFCDNHESLRVSVQNKTLEVEALLRSLTTLTEHFDPKSKVADEIQRATDDLRQDWINTTNCLDKRIEISRKYLAILNSINNLSKELDSLDNFNKGRPTTTERTEEDIKSNVDQLFVQLTNQVKNFNTEYANKNNTELMYSQTLDGKQSISDINKQDLFDNSNRLLNELVERKKSIIKDLDSKRVKARKKSDPPPAHQRPQQVDPPRFTRVLSDKDVEPFSTVELECETDDANCQVEWFMNNYKKIPPSIKHVISRENNQHKLTISNFSPICCGTYIVRASNNAGQATIQCKLRLAGIKEAQNEQYQQQSNNLIKQQTSNFSPQQHNNNFQSSSPAISTTSSFSHWRPSSKNNQQQQQQQNNSNNRSKTTVTTTDKTITRIIEGVGSSERDSPKNQQSVRISQLTGDSDTDTNTNTNTSITNLDRIVRETLPVTQVTYAGPNENLSSVKSNNLLRVTNSTNNSYIVDSPISSTTFDSRSVSRSPFEGTPQPPVFVQGLTDSMSRCCSRAGLVCLVVGNPPPTIEWLHNNQKIATTKCPQTNNCPRASLCKLTIETVNNKTQGQYVCKASNRLGQTSTGITLKNK